MEKGFDPDEDAAVREIVAAFEQASGKRVELDQPLQNIVAKVLAALSAGRPPDFAFGTNTDYWYGQWAYEDRLIDLSDVIGPFAKPVRLDAIGTSKLPAVTRVGLAMLGFACAWLRSPASPAVYLHCARLA